jgi:hypothetical protein
VPEHSGALTSPFDDAYPGPYVFVRITWDGSYAEVPGLIDTGADLSFVPSFLVSTLGMQKVSELDVSGILGPQQEQDTYIVRLQFHGFTFESVEVALTNFGFCLIGRDVLGQLVTEMDGPAGTFRLTAP